MKTTKLKPVITTRTIWAIIMNHLDLFSGIGGFALAAKWTWVMNMLIL